MKKVKGFTLIELMIAMVLGLFVIGAVITIYLMTVSASSDTVKSARLNHDLALAMTLMVNDIKRTGYWGGAIAEADVSNNPFMASTARPALYDSNQCIVYSYDANPPITVDSDEYYGFRLNNGVLEIRFSGTTNANCTNGAWVSNNLIDEDDITVTTLSFTPTYTCLNITTPASTIASTSTECTTVSDSVIELRQLEIVLTGELSDDAAVTSTVTETVMLRNNRIL